MDLSLQEKVKTSACWWMLMGCVLVLTGCGSGYATLNTTVTPLATEDIGGPCQFDLTLSSLSHVQRGVLVLYERGDTDALYNDVTLREGVKALQYSILWVHECDAKSFADLQPNADQGPARMLFTALDQLSQISGHGELATARVVLYGFSAAGVLTTSMANVHPARLLGVIQYAAGSAHVNLDNVPASEAASAIPRLILANASDRAAGTSRSYRYFQRGRAQGAPWGYAVQNSTGHCCNLSTRDVILPWIQSITGSAAGAEKTAEPSASAGTLSRFVCTPDGVEDVLGEVNCKFTDASIGSETIFRGSDSGWLPDQASGAAWLTWVTNTATN